MKANERFLMCKYTGVSREKQASIENEEMQNTVLVPGAYSGYSEWEFDM
jgi:hypothetical protein